MKSAVGEKAFDLFFSEIYSERWPQIKEALLNHEKKIARQNLFYKESFDLPGVLGPCADLKNCFELSEDFDLGIYSTTILPFYRMDPASLFPALALQVRPGEMVLDMCAAPGGKSLVLIEDLVGRGDEPDLSGRFVANEMSAKRRFRMMSVFKRYLPPEVRRMVKIKGVDASIIGLERKLTFDRILLDAPCSGERGVVNKKSELSLWKPKRSKNFGIRQYSLLSSAFMALKPGGRIVYSTCSISPYENDDVIAKLHKRHEGKFKILKSPFDEGESTQYGTQFLPDQKGWGPIFYSIIEKNED
jgi:16S rRNA C967 or C1407 C5-methylase (RsmB/RsmF family)